MVVASRFLTLTYPPPSPETHSKRQTSPGELHLYLARASLRQALTRYSPLRRPQPKANTALQASIQTQLDLLMSSVEKLDQNVIRIAVFGLVSRGKSAVLNALLGQKVLQTGPINGVTQWPRSVRWTASSGVGKDGKSAIQIELIDTPGLDEVGGEVRGELAKQVTHQADLILFVVVGDITRTEYQALCELKQAQKPLILVFNKIDLYPEVDRQAIYQNLQILGNEERQPRPDREEEFSADFPKKRSVKPQLLKSLEIVRVAAEPAPIQVRLEWPDGRITHDWETPPPQVDELKQKILEILNREGRSLIALNALMQGRDAEVNIAKQTLKLRQSEAEDLIWKFAKYKAIAVGLNPIAILDVLGAALTDLALIRALARLYGLPITNYEAGQLLKTILLSAGGVLLSELGSNLILGFGKTSVAMSPEIGIPTIAGVAVTQAGIAAYGAYTVGHAAQAYLENGCTWGPLGQDRVMREILDQVDRNTIIYRLQQELNF